MKACLHLPLNFEALQQTRMLCLLLAKRPEVGTGALYAYRLWIEWATSAQAWRPLACPYQGGNPLDYAWNNDDLTAVIESFCGWVGSPGGLLIACVQSGFMHFEKRDEQYGLVLTDFVELNEHLLPGYKSIQARGGEALARKRQLEQDMIAAKERQTILEKQGVLPFGKEAPSKEEERLCYALLMRLDRACGQPVRPAANYYPAILDEALRVIRNFIPTEIDAVELLLIRSREDPQVVKIPDRVLMNFSNYVKQAKEES